MNLLQITNLFNQISQGLYPRIKFYHYGFYSEINDNPDNNFNRGNLVGVQRPSVQLLYPSSKVNIKEGRVVGTIDCRLIFADNQFYQNDGASDPRTVAQVQSELEALVINFISEFQRIGRTPPYQIGLVSDVVIEYLSDRSPQRLVVLEATFSIHYNWFCPIDIINVSLLPSPFEAIPPASNLDYETL